MSIDARTSPSPSPEPLNEEERALAQRLARLGPHGQPSPAVDARILAAAQASLAGQRRTRSRWPMALGVAASLTLAIGLAWRLRPLPDTLPVHDEATAAMQAAVSTEQMSAESAAPAKPTAPARMPAPVAAPAGADDSARIVAEPESAPSTPPHEPLRQLAPAQPVPAQPTSKQSAPEQSAPVVFDEPSPIDIPPAPPPSPPAPPPSAFPTSPASSASKAAPPPSAPRTDATQAARRQRARTMERRDTEAAAAVIARDSYHLQNAYANSAQGRHDWLRDIRALRDAGQIDDARDLLRDFRARYPDYPLADDLQALLQ